MLAPDPWRAARTFDDLLGLARAFLTGDLASFPGWGAGDLDEESDALEPTLLALNAAGVLTVASQPGRPFGPGHDGWSWGGRAFVGGFCRDGATAAALVERAHGAGLLALVAPPAGAPRAKNLARAGEAPVGLRDGVPYLVLSTDARADELEIFLEHAGPTAADALAPCPFVWVFDPVWGRRGRLTRALGGVSFDAANDPGRRP